MASDLFLKLSSSESDVDYDLSKDLSDDPDDWISEILNHVLTRHPYLRDSLAAPEFELFDETN